jgi:acyl-CoA synthetase (AMP-forming)/AMP-acid ligase II
MNTTDFLSIATAICPDRDFIVFNDKKWTFMQTHEKINKLANGLISLGVEKGDRVGMLQVNCNEYIEAYFAVAKIGAIFVPLNFRAKADELSYMIANAEAKILFVGNRYQSIVNDMLPQLPSVKECIGLEAENGKKSDYEELLSASAADSVWTEIEDDEITLLMYTAGTTGRPKGVPLRHSGFVSYVLDNVEPANPEIEEKNLLTVPLYHIAGVQAMLAGVYGGRTLVLMRQFEVREWLSTVHQNQVARAMLIPTMLKWIIDHPEFDQYDLTSLKIITYGAASMPFEVISKAIERMPWVRFINAFGQTETASTITVLGPEDHNIEGTEREKEKKLKRLTSSIGRPLPDVQVKIVSEEGDPLPPMQVGQILAKGPRIMTGYWRNKEKTEQVITGDGWLYTGDKGWMDEDGYIYLSGRADDMIIRGGENVSPEEVENVLYSNSKIDEAAVIGVPDPEWGQQPRAIVVLKNGSTATEEEVIEYCRSLLAGFKRPHSVVFVDSLPRNPLGKIIKRELRERYGQP